MKNQNKNTHRNNHQQKVSRSTFSFSQQMYQITENILIIFFFLLRTIFQVVELLIAFLYKHKKAIFTILIIAVDIAILVPAFRLFLFTVEINLNNEFHYWDLAETVKAARQTYVDSNLFADWLHNLGGSCLGALLRLAILLGLVGGSTLWGLWLRETFKKSRSKRRHHNHRR